MAGSAGASSVWSRDPSKAYFEMMSLIWAPISLFCLLGGLFGTGAYHYCNRNTYLLISIALCSPGVLVPVLFPSPYDVGRPYRERFWVKAGVWIAIYSFYGNYFWTHYFYQLLGARYLFDAHRFNDVPIVCYICTYFYFTLYFALVNVILRRVKRFSSRYFHPYMQNVAWWAAIVGLAYGTAVGEAVSIQHWPLYTYKEKTQFVTVGSIVYALYFIVGFPMFYGIDEPPVAIVNGVLTSEVEDNSGAPKRVKKYKQTIWQVAMNSLAATAIVTLLLDLWRLYLGDIYALGGKVVPVPFIYQGVQKTKRWFDQYLENLGDITRILWQKWARVKRYFPLNARMVYVNIRRDFRKLLRAVGIKSKGGGITAYIRALQEWYIFAVA